MAEAQKNVTPTAPASPDAMNNMAEKLNAIESQLKTCKSTLDKRIDEKIKQQVQPTIVYYDDSKIKNNIEKLENEVSVIRNLQSGLGNQLKDLKEQKQTATVQYDDFVTKDDLTSLQSYLENRIDEKKEPVYYRDDHSEIIARIRNLKLQVDEIKEQQDRQKKELTNLKGQKQTATVKYDGFEQFQKAIMAPEQIDEKLGKVDDKLKEVDDKLKEVDKKLGGLDGQINEKLEDVKERLEDMEERLGEVDEQLEDLDERIDEEREVRSLRQAHRIGMGMFHGFVWILYVLAIWFFIFTDFDPLNTGKTPAIWAFPLIALTLLGVASMGIWTYRRFSSWIPKRAGGRPIFIWESVMEGVLLALEIIVLWLMVFEPHNPTNEVGYGLLVGVPLTLKNGIILYRRWFSSTAPEKSIGICVVETVMSLVMGAIAFIIIPVLAAA